MIKYFKTSFPAILIPCLIALIVIKDSLAFYNVIIYNVIIVFMALTLLIKNKVFQIVIHSLILICYIGFWFVPNLLEYFTFNSGSTLPIVVVLLFPFVGFFLISSNSDSGLRGALQVRATFKMQDRNIASKANKIITPFSLLFCSILCFPLIFYFNETFKNLIAILIIALTILFIELYIVFLVNRKKKKDKEEMNKYIQEIKDKNKNDAEL